MSERKYLVANGDLRLSANQKCWPEQQKMEVALTKALKDEGDKFGPARKDIEDRLAELKTARESGEPDKIEKAVVLSKRPHKYEVLGKRIDKK